MLDTGRARVAIVTALVVEVALAFALPPSIGVDVTWSALRWVVPTASALLAAVVTAHVVGRQRSSHLFGTFFLFTAVNSVLQTAVFLLL